MKANALKRFSVEARAISQLSHENLVVLKDFGIARIADDDGRTQGLTSCLCSGDSYFDQCLIGFADLFE